MVPPARNRQRIPSRRAPSGLIFVADATWVNAWSNASMPKTRTGNAAATRGARRRSMLTPVSGGAGNLNPMAVHGSGQVTRVTKNRDNSNLEGGSGFVAVRSKDDLKPG